MGLSKMDLYPAFLLLLLALAAQSQPLIGDNPANEQGDQITVECPPGSSINGTCVGTHCVVECGSGKKVEMECPEGGIKIDGSTATCGKKVEFPSGLEFPPCFPFCDKEGQAFQKDLEDGCFPFCDKEGHLFPTCFPFC